jgi:PTS system fructose-specific IIA component
LCKSSPSLSKELVVSELIEREAAFPTGLGHGVAVPHAYSGALDSRFCVIAQIPNGVDFGAPDDEPAKLVFLLLSPPGDPEGHLATLADIARLVADEEIRERLMDEPDLHEVVRIIREAHG